MWSTAFEAAPLIKPPALQGMSDFRLLGKKFKDFRYKNFSVSRGYTRKSLKEYIDHRIVFPQKEGIK
jgi:hypothetical protein